MKRSTCGSSNDTVYDDGPRVASVMNPFHWKSSTLQKGTRYVELFLVVDNTEFKKYRNLDTIRHRMIEIVNHVDKLYRALNIRVALIGLDVWTRTDQIVVSPEPSITLDKFLEWRKIHLLKKKPHDNAQLVTGVDFSGTTVGLATKLAMCSGDSGGVNQDHSESPIGAASTMAHEMGHNLGMSHDEDVAGCNCATRDGSCVMARSVGQVYPRSFSSCSKADLQSFLSSYQTECLSNEPNADDLFGGPVCGNQFLERGEECDCGSLEECSNPCCNATTCRLKNGAECAQGDCCHQCQFRAVGDVCRRRSGDCDLSEYCSGNSGECPSDDFQENGTPCHAGKGYCYNGECPSHDQQCQKLWGPGAQVASETCFKRNIQGERGFHCRKTEGRFIPCTPKDVMCGLLHCKNGENQPLTRAWYMTRLGGGIECKVAELPKDDTWDSEDPGLVPTGTKCSEEMVCYQGQCQDLTVYGAKNCSAKCNNRGVCNHKRQCHCDPGWAPPDCAWKLSDPPTGGAALTVVAVLGSLILVALLIIGGVAYYKYKSAIFDCLMNYKYSQKKTPQKSSNTSSASGLTNPLFQEGSNKVTTKPNTANEVIGRPRLIATTSDLQDMKSVYITMQPNCRPPEVAKPSSSARPVPPSLPGHLKPSTRPPLPPSTQRPPKPVPTYPQMKPNPPTKPLPELKVKQGARHAPLRSAPVPPVKPTSVTPNQSKQGFQSKVALKPPGMRR